MSGALVLASLTVGPVQFDTPVWLSLIPVCGLVVVLLGLRSLSGLGSVTRWVAMSVRLIVICLIAGAMAEPQWRREAKDVAVTVIMDASESVPSSKQAEADGYVKDVAAASPDRNNRLGVVTAAKNAYVQALPSKLTRELQRQHLGALDGTNLAGGVRLALAVKPTDAAYRLLLISDGNQTDGNVLQAAEAAKAMGVPIDVLPLRFKYDREVLVDKLVAPANAREGETMNLRIVLISQQPTAGRLNLLMNGEAVDLDPSSEALAARVELRQGINALEVPIKAISTGPQKFQAVFEPDVANGRAVGDVLAENNKSLGVTFVTGQGRVLFLCQDASLASAQPLIRALREAQIDLDIRNAEQLPPSVTDLNAFDAVVLFNQSAYDFTQKAQEDLRQYVHDTGGGVLMVGGPQAFGAGGWIGSPLEDALPVKLDPPQKRQMPRGALALVIHSVEAPDGTFLGKKVCEAAVNSLSKLDLAGIIEYGWGGGTDWVHPLSPVGDGTKIKRAINNLMFGDMPDFSPSIELALEGLKKADAGQRHVIMISDGDPASPSTTLLDKYVEAKITISTVGVYPHSGGDTSRMQQISKYTGGRHYHINTQAGLAAIPQIFIKEAQTVRRSLIQEGNQIPVQVVLGGETLRGVTSVPTVNGYVVTGEREGLALVSLKVKEGDPLLAGWQYGLGKVIAYTSDATSRWNTDWVAWGNYRQFWEQQVRWIMRPGGSANVRVFTETRGDQTLVTVEALDSSGERLNFANFKGRVALPDGQGFDVALKQVGPGRYQGVVESDRPGSYVLSLRYAAPDPAAAGGYIEGSVQAAVSRPFADEYRTLEDNMPLLAQVAEMTGGRVLTGQAASDNVWDKTGLKIPVALRPMWLWAVVAAISLFLVDVGVRRVRIDIPAIWRFVRSGFGASRTHAGQHVGGLKAAREAARAKLAERQGAGGKGPTPEELEREARLAAKRAEKVAGAKFELTPEQVRKASAPVAMGGADARVQPLPVKPRPTDAPSDAGAGMGRLLKAKKKAQEEMGEGDKPEG
ncbi:MAG: VWA domain-containing protein [Leptolyngbya sp. PLA1]|nr:VWA domain-containing protein [Leptolyngbya sp. PLA1]